MSDNAFTLSHTRNRPGSLVIFKDGRRSFPLNFDEEFVELLLAYSARVATALAELFPEPKALLGLTGDGQFSVEASTTMAVHEHFSRLVVSYCRAVQDLKVTGEGLRFRQLRNESAALLQAYCSLGYLAYRLAQADTRAQARGFGTLSEKDSFVGVELIALASHDAPYVSRDEWQTYEYELLEAMKEEEKLPLEIRLKLDGNGPLPTELVQQTRPRRRTALKATLPWAGEFMGGEAFKPVLHRAAILLGSDVAWSETGCSLLTQQLLWPTPVPVEACVGGKEALAQLQFPHKEGMFRTALVATEEGNFRTESHLIDGRRTAVLRPLATSVWDFGEMGIPSGLRAAMGI